MENSILARIVHFQFQFNFSENSANQFIKIKFVEEREEISDLSDAFQVSENEFENIDISDSI